MDRRRPSLRHKSSKYLRANQRTAAAVISDQLSDTIGRARPRDERDDIGAPDKPDNPEAVKEAAAPSATAPAQNTEGAPAIANVPAARDLGGKESNPEPLAGVL